jgi:hypothetical protein
MSPNRNLIDPIKNASVIVVYVLLLGVVYATGWWLLHGTALFTGILLTAYTIVFILGGGLLGAWLWVLIKLPSGLAEKYDVIKNKIAAREVATSQDFALELARFFVENFSYFRFDLVAAQVVVKENPAVIFPDEFAGYVKQQDDLTPKSKATEKIVDLGKAKLNGRSCHAYLLPFWFRNEWLGYAVLYADTRLDKFNLHFLKELEEYFIDDQLMHVLHYEQSQLTSF